MSDALEPCSGCSTSSTVFSYTLFSWSLNRVKVVRRVFLPAVSAGVSRDLQTDRNFPSAHSSYNQTFSARSAFGHTGVKVWAHKPCLLGGHLSLVPALHCQSTWDDKGRQFYNQAWKAHACVQITVGMCPGQLLQATCLFSVAGKGLQYKYKVLKATFVLTNEWVRWQGEGHFYLTWSG